MNSFRAETLWNIRILSLILKENPWHLGVKDLSSAIFLRKTDSTPWSILKNFQTQLRRQNLRKTITCLRKDPSSFMKINLTIISDKLSKDTLIKRKIEKRIWDRAWRGTYRICLNMLFHFLKQPRSLPNKKIFLARPLVSRLQKLRGCLWSNL